jgi:hypothetical protein
MTQELPSARPQSIDEIVVKIGEKSLCTFI